jgi:hypothetical protein
MRKTGWRRSLEMPEPRFFTYLIEMKRDGKRSFRVNRQQTIQMHPYK